MSGRCRNCQHCKMGTAPDKAMIFECHRYPPIPVALLTPQGATIAALFPRVIGEESCGEFVAKLSVIQ